MELCQITVKLKVYINPKNWVILSVIQMTQILVIIAVWYIGTIGTIEYCSCSNQFQWLLVTSNNVVIFDHLCFNHYNLLISKLIYTRLINS